MLVFQILVVSFPSTAALFMKPSLILPLDSVHYECVSFHLF